MDGEPPFPAGSRRALVALLVVAAVVLAAAAFGVRAVLGAAGGHDRQPSEAAGVAAAGTTVAGQAIGVSVAGGRSGGPAATGAGTSGGAGGGTSGASGGATSKGGPPASPSRRQGSAVARPAPQLIDGARRSDRSPPASPPARGITPRVARRGVGSSQWLGRHRSVVEWSLPWLVGYRRLQVRYERRADVLLGSYAWPVR